MMMCGLIDLNVVNDEDTEEMTDSPSSSSSSASAAMRNNFAPPPPANASRTPVCLDLWHACAGPLISLPKKGSAVVYLPQGHLEQYASEFPAVDSSFNLAPHVFCRVLDVKLHAEAGSDDVYAQVSMVPESQLEEKWRQRGSEAAFAEEDSEAVGVKTTTPHMFCKTLTASDTSTHGGFSVPRRAAEDCFPALDYKQQRPSQELVAKDLHGTEWRFRHIYRGQPRRHLLTTGWSAFVNKKKLVCGDAVLFLRGDDGVLRLGIRRAIQVKIGASFPPFFGQQLNDFNTLVNSISKRNVFSVYYNPRGCSSEFIIPYRRFLKSLAHSSSTGMRFKLRFETEDAAERRCTGVITGSSDLDPVRWPGSMWRCLKVRWDDVEVTRCNRVSPWEIERSGPVSGAFSYLSSSTKRIRTGFPLVTADFPAPRDGAETSDFVESVRFQKVLQGQEIFGFNNNHFDGVDSLTHHPSQIIRGSCSSLSSSRTSHMGNGVRSVLGHSDISCESTGFGESFRFNRVLQGQETFSNLPYGRGLGIYHIQDGNGPRIIDNVGGPGSGTGWNPLLQEHQTNVHLSSLVQASSPSSVLMFQQASAPAPNSYAVRGANNQETLESNPTRFDISGSYFGKFGIGNQQMSYNLLKEKNPCPNPTGFRNSEEMTGKSSCRLFGFSLTEGSNTINREGNTSQLESPYAKKGSFLPNIEEQLHQKSAMSTKVAGGSCTTERVLQCCRAPESCLQGT